MKFTVENFRGVANADIDVDGIVYVCGKNGSGKTSLLNAVAVALTGEIIPLTDRDGKNAINKTDAGKLIKRDTEKASILASDGENTRRIAYGKTARVSGEGTLASISPVAAGFLDPIALTDKARAEFFGSLLHTKPSEEELLAALTECPAVNAATSESVIKEVRKLGYDEAARDVKEKGTRKKGAWEQITGERFGMKKASEWAAPDYDPALDVTSAQEFLAKLDKVLIAERAKSLLAEDALEKITERAATVGAAKEKVDSLTAQHERAIEKVKAFRAKVADLRPHRPSYPCPHCEGLLQVTVDPAGHSHITKGAYLTQEDLAERFKAKAELDGEIARAEGDVMAAERELKKAQGEYKKAVDAAAYLKNNKDKTHNADKVANLEAQRDEAKRKMHAYTTTKEAQGVAQELSTLLDIHRVLSPEGLRKTKLDGALVGFNQTLAKLCQRFDDFTVSIQADLSFTANGREYALLSESERWLVSAIARLAIAITDGSAKMAVLFDGADVLDNDRRKQFFMMLKAHSPRALVTMTITQRDSAPNLAAAKAGTTYWMESGFCSPLEPDGRPS